MNEERGTDRPEWSGARKETTMDTFVDKVVVIPGGATGVRFSFAKGHGL